MANKIKSFMETYKGIKNDSDKIKFASAKKGAMAHEGAIIWKNFCINLFQRCRIHRHISKVMENLNIHPNQLSKCPDFTKGSNSLSYILLACTEVGLSLYGDDSITELGHLKQNLVAGTQALVTRTWTNACRHVTQSQNKLESLAEQANSTYKCKCLVCHI